MSAFSELYARFLTAFEDESVRIPCCGLKFIKKNQEDLRRRFPGLQSGSMCFRVRWHPAATRTKHPEPDGLCGSLLRTSAVPLVL